MTTAADVFSAKGLTPWWQANVTQQFGGNANGEWGTDFAIAPNTPIGSVTDGRVVFVGPDPNHPQSSIGQIVQVQAPDGSLFHYQHLRASSVQVGQSVAVGDTLGLSGGCPVGGYATGGGCSFTDAYSTGPHIEVRYSPSYNAAAGFWYQAWQDPLAIFRQYAGASVDGASVAAASVTPGATLSTTGTQPPPGTFSPNCKHSIGIAGANICMDPAIDFSARAALLLAGAAFIGFGVITFLAGHEDLRNQVGQQVSVLRKIPAGLAAAGA